MIWLIVGLLAVIVLLLGLVTWQLEKGLTWIAELVRASGQANVRCHNENGEKLDTISQHAARAARPFYAADEEDERRKRDDPTSYYMDRDHPF